MTVSPSQRADLRMPYGPAQRRDPEEDACPLAGTEHDSHWYPAESSGRRHCIGWHAMTRDLTRTRARFHAPYLRGTQSNLIHRSRHTGILVWFPQPFHGFGQAEIVFWDVLTECGPTLRNPELLDAAAVRAARPRPNPKLKYSDAVRLCPKCFPTPSAEPYRVTPIKEMSE